MWESTCWPQLRQLCGIRLPEDGAAALARGLPSLEVLEAMPEGPWTGAGQAVFGCVRQAKLKDCCESFTAHARVSSLLPSLERLTMYESVTINNLHEWEELNTGTERQGLLVPDLADATRLTYLVLVCNDDDEGYHALPPHAWATLSTLPHLRHLALDVTAAEVPQLAHLPAALEVLKVQVDGLYYDQAEDSMLLRRHDVDGPCELCAVLMAAGRLPRLRSLWIHASGMQVHRGALAGLAGARLGDLEELEVKCYGLQLHDVSLLAALHGLRRLHVKELESASPGEWSRSTRAEGCRSRVSATALDVLTF